MSDFFKDKIVIVTGASSGIGEAIARLLSKRGAKVILAARRQNKLETLQKELEKSIAIETDVTQEKSVKNLVAQTMQKFGRIDLLINNAGVLVHKPMAETTMEEIRAVMETNFFAAVSCTNIALPIMKKQKSGIIVNIASIAGRIGFPNLGYYGASKFALVGFSETLRQEVAHEGIHVLTVCPGTIYTPMTKEIVDAAIAKGKYVMPILPETAAKEILSAIEKKKIELFLPKITRLIHFLHIFFPRMIEWLAWKFRPSDPEHFTKTK